MFVKSLLVSRGSGNVLSGRVSLSAGFADVLQHSVFLEGTFQSLFFFSAYGLALEEMGLMLGKRSSLAPRLNKRNCRQLSYAVFPSPRLCQGSSEASR